MNDEEADELIGAFRGLIRSTQILNKYEKRYPDATQESLPRLLSPGKQGEFKALLDEFLEIPD